MSLKQMPTVQSYIFQGINFFDIPNLNQDIFIDMFIGGICF